MPFCPECKGEYLEGYRHCAFCNVELVDKLPEGVKPEPLIKLVDIHEVQGSAEASIVESLLKAHGIECSATGHNVHGVYPFTVDGLGRIRILVKEEDAGRAGEILEKNLKKNNGSEE